MKNLSAFLIGLLFGGGLLVSGMTQPEKVLGFLDIAGRWDPSLAFVMAGALAIAAIGFRSADARNASLLGDPVWRPATSAIDRRLLGGAAIFGVGWGLAGVCPGPALTNLGFGTLPIALFVIAMIAGMIGYEMLSRTMASKQPAAVE